MSMKLLGNFVAVIFLTGVITLSVQPPASAQSTRQKPKPTDYDYKSLAIASIRDTVQEAKKLTDIRYKIRFLIEISALLSDSSKRESADVLDLALAELKEWESQADGPSDRKFIAAYLRNQVIVQYLKTDRDKANKLVEAEKETPPSTDYKPLQKDTSWRTNLNERQSAAYNAVEVATQLLESEPERATALLADSVMQGIVSVRLWDTFQRLRANKSLLLSVQERIATSLRSTVAIDPFSVQSASFLTWDPDMSPSVRATFVQFLLRSLEALVNLSHASASDGGLEKGYMDSMFGAFAVTTRLVIAQHNPNELGRVDLLLDQVAGQVSPKIRDLIKSNSIVEPEDPRERLNEIKREADSDKRDMRLLRLVMVLLRNQGLQDQESVLTDAVQAVTDDKLRATLGDFVSLDRVQRLTKAQKFNDAVKATEQVATAHLRAWALLGLSSTVVTSDRYQAMTLVNAAVKVLEASSPTPRKVEIALVGVAVTSQQDPNRSLEILSLVPKFANAVEGADESSRNAANALHHEVSIGALKILPAQPPEQLSDIQFDPSIRLLAKRDWFGVQKIADSLKDPVLRLAFKMELAKGVLQDTTKTTSTATIAQ